MQLTINTNSANAGLSYVMAAFNSKSTMPILKNVLITPSGPDCVEFTATNNEQQLSAKVPCQWKEQASITIEGKKLASLFKSLPKDADAKLSITKGKVTLKCGKSRFTMNTLPANEYPDFNIEGAAESHTINGSDLRQSLGRCFVAMASQDVRFYLNGMHLNFMGESVDVVATDGHRMNMATIDASGEPLAITIPRDSVKPVMGVLSNDDVALRIGQTSLTASDGARTVTVKLIDGRFPDYNRVKPKDNQLSVVFSKSELEGAVSRALLLSNEKYRGIKLILSDGQCEVTGSNPEQEHAEESIACSYSGSDFTIAFNGQYVLDALGSVDTDDVVVHFGTESSPVLIEDGTFSAVVMPIRL